MWFRFTKQFYKLEPGEHAGKLVEIRPCTVSVFAPFCIGPYWLKAKSHLAERKRMERGNYSESEMAKANAKLAVTAGQMVLRVGEFAKFQGYRYLGIYQSIARNSIPLFVTAQYYNEHLIHIFQNHDVDAFDATVVGRIMELPLEFKEAFGDYVRDDDTPDGDFRTTVRSLKGKQQYAILVGENGDNDETGIEYIRPTAYLDGDVWVAVNEGGITSFKSRFCNLADREDLSAAIADLKREVNDEDVVYQFDSVDKRFGAEEEENESFSERSREGKGSGAPTRKPMEREDGCLIV